MVVFLVVVATVAFSAVVATALRIVVERPAVVLLIAAAPRIVVVRIAVVVATAVCSLACMLVVLLAAAVLPLRLVHQLAKLQLVKLRHAKLRLANPRVALRLHAKPLRLAMLVLTLNRAADVPSLSPPVVLRWSSSLRAALRLLLQPLRLKLLPKFRLLRLLAPSASAV